MNDLCECKNLLELKVEADISADAIWCNKCNTNLEVEELSLSTELKEELLAWTLQYGQWIDWETDRLVPGGIELEEVHNKQGLKLTEKVKKELAGKYSVSFSPSEYAKYLEG